MTNFFQKSLERVPKTWAVIGFLIALCSPLVYAINEQEKQAGFVLGLGIGIIYAALHRLFKWKI